MTVFWTNSFMVGKFKVVATIVTAEQPFAKEIFVGGSKVEDQTVLFKALEQLAIDRMWKAGVQQ